MIRSGSASSDAGLAVQRQGATVAESGRCANRMTRKLVAGSLGAMEPVAIPDSHRDLLERPLNATLVTVMPSGQPQATIVWYKLDGPDVMIITMKGFQKERNMRARPKVSLVIIDPDDTARWIEVRGTVELFDGGADELLDEITGLYTDMSRYFGEVVPAELAETQIPVIARITPTRLRAEAV